jgi:hypothetical protein
MPVEPNVVEQPIRLTWTSLKMMIFLLREQET